MKKLIEKGMLKKYVNKGPPEPDPGWAIDDATKFPAESTERGDPKHEDKVAARHTLNTISRDLLEEAKQARLGGTISSKLCTLPGTPQIVAQATT